MSPLSQALLLLNLLAPCLLVTASPTASRTANRGVKMPFSKRQSQGLAKRQSIDVPLDNTVWRYLVTTTIGGQTVYLDLDTGSSDVWAIGPGACSSCDSGTYDPSLSSTVGESDVGDFSISYVDGSTASGYFVTDELDIGGTAIYPANPAVATSVTGGLSTGIIGIGMDATESIVSQGGSAYNGLLDDMLSQGLIQSRAYSLYLDDLEAGTGDILFGAYDASKYLGDLVALPIQSYSSLDVEWSSIAIIDSSGTTDYTTASCPRSATLDTGTSLTTVPTDIYDNLAAYFGVSDGDIDCSWSSVSGSVDYGFGDGAVTISVPFSELVIANGDVCNFGISPLDDYTLFGDTFLRSAYVLYDYDTMTISLACASWDTSCTDCQQAISTKR